MDAHITAQLREHSALDVVTAVFGVIARETAFFGDPTAPEQVAAAAQAQMVAPLPQPPGTCHADPAVADDAPASASDSTDSEDGENVQRALLDIEAAVTQPGASFDRSALRRRLETLAVRTERTDVLAQIRSLRVIVSGGAVADEASAREFRRVITELRGLFDHLSLQVPLLLPEERLAALQPIPARVDVLLAEGGQLPGTQGTTIRQVAANVRSQLSRARADAESRRQQLPVAADAARDAPAPVQPPEEQTLVMTAQQWRAHAEHEPDCERRAAALEVASVLEEFETADAPFALGTVGSGPEYAAALRRRVAAARAVVDLPHAPQSVAEAARSVVEAASGWASDSGAAQLDRHVAQLRDAYQRRDLALYTLRGKEHEASNPSLTQAQREVCEQHKALARAALVEASNEYNAALRAMDGPLTVRLDYQAIVAPFLPPVPQGVGLRWARFASARTRDEYETVRSFNEQGSVTLCRHGGEECVLRSYVADSVAGVTAINTTLRVLRRIRPPEPNAPGVLLPTTGFYDQGRIFLQFPFIPGGTLEAPAFEPPQGSAPRVLLASRIVDQVAELHRVGVYHGDIKASNVLLCDPTTPRLADWIDTVAFAATGTVSLSTIEALPLADLASGQPRQGPQLDAFQTGMLLRKHVLRPRTEPCAYSIAELLSREDRESRASVTAASQSLAQIVTRSTVSATIAAFDPPPPYWTLQTVPVDRMPSNFAERVLGPLFKQEHRRIASVQRLQHHFLWTRYSAERSFVRGRHSGRAPPLPQVVQEATQDLGAALDAQLDAGANEVLLYHATEAWGAISLYGFDPSRSGEAHGGILGQATYFTSQLDFALEHAEDHIIVARVVLGDLCDARAESMERTQHFRRPPERPDGAGEHESVFTVDRRNISFLAPEFAVYRHAQAYPELLVTLVSED